MYPCLACGSTSHLRVNAPRSQNTDVTVLTDGDFDALVGDGTAVPWLIEIYAPWCGACKELRPVWERAARKLPPIARVGAIDATTQKQLAKRFQPSHYPTIVLVRDGAVYKYAGERTVKALRAFVREGFSGAGVAGPLPKAGESLPERGVYDTLWVRLSI